MKPESIGGFFLLAMVVLLLLGNFFHGSDEQHAQRQNEMTWRLDCSSGHDAATRGEIDTARSWYAQASRDTGASCRTQ